MNWWQPILQMLAGGSLVFVGFWAGSRVAKGESIIPKREKPPVPIYTTPEERNAIRAEARKVEAEQGITFERMG
jgi:hypothetical protein